MSKGHRTDANAAWAGAKKAYYSMGKRGSAAKTVSRAQSTDVCGQRRADGHRVSRFLVSTTDLRFRGKEEKLFSSVS